MAVKLAYNKVEQFADGNGVPYSGAKLFTYVGGSVNTKQTTYTESTGTTPNTNPVELDSAGRLPQPVWLTTGVTYKLVLAPSTDTDPPSSPIWTLDGITGINDSTTSVNEWVSGPAPTFVSATSFTLAGDQTSTFHVGRRLKTTNSGGTVYSVIKTAAFASVTTITVVNDSGTLDSGLSAVSYGLLAATNTSAPLLDDNQPIRSGSADKTKKLRIELDGLTTDVTRVQTPPDYDHRIMSQTHGADIASATGAGTLNLDTATGDLVDVTGTTGITAITLAEGKTATVRFTGALLLTNGASLVLPGAANITTAAGDVGTFRGYAAGVVRLVSYQLAIGAAGGGLIKLATGTVAAAATLDIVMTTYTTFRNKVLVADFIPATDAQSFGLRVSTDGGSSYDAGAANYSYALTGNDSAGATLITGNTDGTNPTAILITPANVGNATTEGVSFVLTMFHTISTAIWPQFVWEANYTDATATPRGCLINGIGTRRAAQDTDAVRFFFSSGNIASGTWTLYGYN